VQVLSGKMQMVTKMKDQNEIENQLIADFLVTINSGKKEQERKKNKKLARFFKCL